MTLYVIIFPSLSSLVYIVGKTTILLHTGVTVAIIVTVIVVIITVSICFWGRKICEWNFLTVICVNLCAVYTLSNI